MPSRQGHASTIPSSDIMFSPHSDVVHAYATIIGFTRLNQAFKHTVQYPSDIHNSIIETNNKSSLEVETVAKQGLQAILQLLEGSDCFWQLQLQGIHVDEERTVTDPELLMEIMEIRESVENAKDLDALKSIQTQMQTKLEQCQKLFADAYKKQDFRAAVSVVQRMSYYERVIEEIIKKL
eukprot:Gb_15910 [translate_table: standard]